MNPLQLVSEVQSGSEQIGQSPGPPVNAMLSLGAVSLSQLLHLLHGCALSQDPSEDKNMHCLL